MTLEGGIYNLGTVYELNPTGTETVLYNFTGSADGGKPTSTTVFDKQGNLYGITREGGAYNLGTVFKLTP